MTGGTWRGEHRLRGLPAVALGTLVAVLVATGALAAWARAAAGPRTVTLTGHVLAAGAPIARARVQLLAGGPRRAVPLGTATSSRDGTFTIAYRPPSGRRTPLYVVSDGGHGVDHRVRLMSVAGLAGARPTSVYVDEQSTVAATYALARFLHGDRAVGATPGLPNAAATAANLYESRAGKVSFVLATPPNGNATEALATFNTLANALGTCTTGGAGACGRLLDAARPRGQARPVDTLDALVDIARNPSEHARRLFALSRKLAGRAAATPVLSRPPSSWVLAVAYVGAGMNAPGRMAFDAFGNIWANNNFQTPGTTPGLNLTALSPTGRPILGSPITGGGVQGSGWGIAIDQKRRVWLANFAGSSVSLFDHRGRALSPPGGYARGGISKPQGLAVDQHGNVWIANFGNNSVTLIPHGHPRLARNITGGGLYKPFGIQVDARGDVWVSNGAESTKPGSVTELTPDGRPTASSPITGGGLRSAQGLALDSRGNVWVANLLDPGVTRVSPNGTVTPDSPIRHASIHGGWGIAVDGDDHVWVASFFRPGVTELCGVRTSTCPSGARRTGAAISPPVTGYRSRGLEHLTAVQIDPSGNVWLANNWTTGSPLSQFVGGDGLVELVGAAAPVAAPLLGLPRRP
jgi:streptogramin lyase